MESGKGEASTKIEDENNESVGNEAAARTSTVGTIEEATTPLYPETENAFPWYQRSNNKGDEGSTESTVLTELIGTGPRRLEASEKELTHTPTLSWKHIYHQRILLEHNWREGHYDTKTLIGHAEAIYCLQFDDDKVISGSRDDTIKIWDIRTGGCRATLHGHLGSVLCLQYDDKRIISGSSDSTIRIWDLATCRNIRTLQGHSESVLNVKFDTKYIVSCSKDTTVVIWSTKTGKRLRTLVSHRAAVNAIQYENGLVVSASGDRQIKVWDVKTGRELKNLVGHTRGIACIQFDGRTIVSGSSDHTIKVWDVQTGANLMTLTGHANLVRTLQFNSVRIVSGSYDETLKVWDMKTGTKLLDLKGGHTSRVFKLQFSDTKIVSCSQDQVCVLAITSLDIVLKTDSTNVSESSSGISPKGLMPDFSSKHSITAGFDRTVLKAYSTYLYHRFLGFLLYVHILLTRVR
ncbi:WD40-repeat-containing domain protein [Gaertneriomyces semiglobifer]|nr:WD40-repeat-containing domain protein [Gaertneriomyces semiglobifer]